MWWDLWVLGVFQMGLVLLDYGYIAKLCCEMLFNNIFLLFWFLISKHACFLLKSMENA